MSRKHAPTRRHVLWTTPVIIAATAAPAYAASEQPEQGDEYQEVL